MVIPIFGVPKYLMVVRRKIFLINNVNAGFFIDGTDVRWPFDYS